MCEVIRHNMPCVFVPVYNSRPSNSRPNMGVQKSILRGRDKELVMLKDLTFKKVASHIVLRDRIHIGKAV